MTNTAHLIGVLSLVLFSCDYSIRGFVRLTVCSFIHWSVRVSIVSCWLCQKSVKTPYYDVAIRIFSVCELGLSKRMDGGVCPSPPILWSFLFFSFFYFFIFFFFFFSAFSFSFSFYLRHRTSIRGSVRPSVGWSVGYAFVRRSTRRTYWPTWPCLLWER